MTAKIEMVRRRCIGAAAAFKMFSAAVILSFQNGANGVHCFAITTTTRKSYGTNRCSPSHVLGSSITSRTGSKSLLKVSPAFCNVAGIALQTHREGFMTRLKLASSSSLSAEENTEIPAEQILLHGESTARKVGIWPCRDELDERLVKIALPCIANFAINPLIGAVDLFWINRMKNTLAVAGQAAANQVFNSFFWFTSFLPSVTATLVAKESAKGDKEGVQDVITQAIIIGLLISIFGSALMLLQPDKVLRAVLRDKAPALEFAKPYLLIRSLAFMPSLFSITGFSAFRGVMDTVTPFKISLFANVFNAVFDPVLIFSVGMGVSGAALATLFAEIISAAIFAYLMFQRGMLRWSKLFRIPSWKKLSPLIKGGAALQIRNLALNITFLAVTRVTQSIDDTGVAAAAHAIAIQTFQIGGIVLLAISTVAQTMVPNEMIEQFDATTGQKTGGLHAAKAVVNRLMSWGFVLGICLGALQIVVLPFLHKATPFEEVRRAALIPSYLASLYQIINGLVFIGEGVMVGCGNFLQLSLSTAIATIATLWALKTFPQKYGLTGVWMGFGVFNTLRLAGVWLHQTRFGPLARRNLKKYDP